MRLRSARASFPGTIVCWRTFGVVAISCVSAATGGWAGEIEPSMSRRPVVDARHYVAVEIDHGPQAKRALSR
jgi:hypothetical protein